MKMASIIETSAFSTFKTSEIKVLYQTLFKLKIQLPVTSGKI
jgi:hypothetical protein